MMWRRANRIPDEELDWAIRSALRAETEGLEPSPQVWNRVRARIEHPVPEEKRQPRGISWHTRLANVVQGAVLAIFVLGFGLGLSRGIVTSGWNSTAVPTVPAVTHSKASSRYPKDILNTGRLMQIDKPKPEPGAWRWPQ